MHRWKMCGGFRILLMNRNRHARIGRPAACATIPFPVIIRNKEDIMHTATRRRPPHPLPILMLAIACILTGCAGNPGQSAPVSPPPAATASASPTGSAEDGMTQPGNASGEALLQSIRESGQDPSSRQHLSDAIQSGLLAGVTVESPDAGIRLDDLCRMMQQVVTARYGTASKFLDAYPVSGKRFRSYPKDGVATRMNLAELVFYTSCEMELGLPFQTFTRFVDEQVDGFWNKDGAWRSFPNAALMGRTHDATLSANADLWQLCRDIREIDELGNSTAVQYAVTAFDRITSERVMSLHEDMTFRPDDPVSLSEAVLAAWHYGRWLMPAAYRPLEEVGGYNRDILADELLAAASELPDATAANLPAWKGFNVDHLSNAAHGALSGLPELWTFEADIRTISEAGGNFANVRVGWGSLSGPAYPAEDQVNVAELEYLDRILAAGIRYGVHIQFCFTEGPAMKPEYDLQTTFDKTASIFTDTAYRDLTARYWRMLSKRYATIPNKYLSFCLMNECTPVDDANYGETMRPLVDAIRESAPERLIVADVHAQTGVSGESMARMGVALCAHLYDPNPVFVVMQETMDANPDFYRNLSWPFVDESGKRIFGKEALDLTYHGVSLNDVRNTARKHGVGFMVGEFGFFGGDTAGFMIKSPIPGDTIRTILSDLIMTFDAEGMPWCAEYRTEFSLTNSHTLDETIAYSKIDGSPLYVDTDMMAFFRQMTGASR